MNMPITEQVLAEPLHLSDRDYLKVKLENADTFEFVLTTTEGGYPSSAAKHDFMKRFPERRAVPGRFETWWHVPTTDVSATILDRLWPKDRISVTDEARVTLDYLLATLQWQGTAIHRSARYHEFMGLRPAIQGAAVPTTNGIAPDFDLQGGLTPMLHQRVALANCVDVEGYGLFMEQGTGKTAVVIGRVDAESDRPRDRMYRTLIVAPKNVRGNWQREFERFSVVKGNVTVLRGGAFDRMKDVITAMVPKHDDQKYTVVVCSYETLWQSWDVISKIEWDLAVLDESHYIKWPRTKRAQFAFKLRDISKQRMCLTGTPVCNTPIDMYAQFEFLRKGGSGFTSFEQFRSFYGVFAVQSDTGVKRLVDVQNLPFMRERVARSCFVVKKEEALPYLPKKTWGVHEVEMSDEQQKIYDQVRDQLYFEIKDDMGGEKTMNANNILTKLLRLSQITSGFVTWDPIIDLDTGDVEVPKQIDRIDPNPKVEELIKLIRGHEEDGIEPIPADQKIIVWASWVQDIKTIMARLQLEGIGAVEFYGKTKDAERTEAERRFNTDRDCRVFVANAACGGTGLNLVGYDWWNAEPKLSTDTTTEVFFSQDWSNPKRAQAEDRACRRGQRRPVHIIDLCIPNTIDEEIRARVLNKRLMAHEVQNLNDILTRVLGRSL